ncbi:phosphoribosyltransferase family protein [Isoptericola haloaureus]|uniref:Phosphoribosyltransferase family protein n=1 Tax=Isoptericola haloaureus TaxID=1542902 RepID=A0ABU7Z773_9MICO
MPFTDRTQAGRRLAEALAGLRDEDVVVLGLPRGGVPVAFEVAVALDAPLDVIVVRKLGVPFQPELAMGAVGEGDVRVVDDEVVRRAQITAEELAGAEATERAELERRLFRIRRDHPLVPIEGRTAVVVDDGVATGSTARTACLVARERGAARVVVAVPVGAAPALDALKEVADEVVFVESPRGFRAVGEWYADFRQVDDGQVVELLDRAANHPGDPVGDPADPPAPRDEAVEIRAGAVMLNGQLTVPDRPVGLVVFAHGSGSSRHSPRNRHVAQVLNEAGLGTLLFDLLTAREEWERPMVFDIRRMAARLVDATWWLRTAQGWDDFPIGYFGASTGAAAALRAAAQLGHDVSAVVSRGGRPDLAADWLHEVKAPTLLLVGSEDPCVLDLNRRAQRRLRCENELAVVPGATHLFEEPGTLDQAAVLARDWFLGHLPQSTTTQHAVLQT